MYRGKPPTSQYKKRKLLAEIIAEKKCLLLLDGLEPLQYPPGEMCGKLKDQAMQASLKTISRSFSGLCVITSRCVVEDIKTTEGRTTITHNLDNLGIASEGLIY